MRALLPVLVAIGLAAIGQLTMKTAMAGAPLAMTSPLEAVRSILSRPLVYVALVFYGVSSFLWLIALSKLPLSYMYPFTALLLVIITLASALIFKETLNPWQIGGVATICLGLVMITRGAPG
jgi:drug/metabolite transporter (DMT)-like permease